MRSCLLLLPLLALPALAADPPKHRADGDAAVAARRVLLDHCAACHSGPDKKPFGRVLVNDWSALVGNAGPIPFVSQDNEDLRSQVVEFMTDGSMPPGGRKPVPMEQIAAVENWIKRGAPEYPTAFDDDTVLKVIAADIARVEQEKGKEYVQHVRYVSLAHLVDMKEAALAAAEAELFTALAGRTHGDQIRLTKTRHEVLKKEPAAGTPAVLGKAVSPVAGSAGTVYRLDLKELRWDGGGKLLFEEVKTGSREGDFRMRPFDLIQLEYPYSHTPTDDARKKATDAAVADMNAHRNKTGAKDPLAQLRAVPFVRGDWLAKALWKDGRPTPLADDLDSLGELAEGLAKTTDDRRVGTGPDFVPFAGGPKVTDATAPPVWAWYQPAVAPAAPPFHFTVAVEGSPPFQMHQKVRLLADSDKPTAVSLVEVQADFVDVLLFGDEKSRRPTADVTKNTPVAPKADGKIELSLIDANAGKPIFYLLHASPQATPHREPVVVRSKHEKSAVWRVLPHEADAAADRGPPVRQVLRIEVTPKKKMD